MRRVPRLGGWLWLAAIAGIASCGDDGSSPGGSSGGQGGSGAESAAGGSSGKGGRAGSGGAAGGTKSSDAGAAGEGGEAPGGAGGEAPAGAGGQDPVGAAGASEGGEAGAAGMSGGGAGAGAGGEGGVPVSCEDLICADDDPCTVDGCSEGACTQLELNCADLKGGDGGTAFTELCPEGEVVIGYSGYIQDDDAGAYYGVVARLTTHCGIPTFPEGDGPVTIAEGETLGTYGSAFGTAWTRTCPTDHVVVGFGGSLRSVGTDVLADIDLRCAPLNMEDDALVIGDDVPLGGTNTIPGDSPFELVHCPGDQVAHGSAIRGGLLIDAFTVICAALP